MNDLLSYDGGGDSFHGSSRLRREEQLRADEFCGSSLLGSDANGEEDVAVVTSWSG